MTHEAHTRSTKLAHFISALAVSYGIFIAAPLDVYITNRSEFGETLTQVALPFILYSILAFCFFVGFSILFRFASWIFTAYVALAIVFLILLNLLSYGENIVLDGAIHAYSLVTWITVLELAGLAFLVGVLFWLGKRLAKEKLLVSVLLLIWATVPSTIGDFSGNRDQVDLDFARLSPEKSIIHLMVDSLQLDMFQEILGEDETLRQAFDGFTLFENHSGYSNWTSLSLATIFTGHSYFQEHFDDSQDTFSVLQNWMSTDSLLSDFQQQGFDVATVQPGSVICDMTVVPCTTVSLQRATLIAEGMDEQAAGRDKTLSFLPWKLSNTQRTILDLALFRLAPAALKAAIYNDGRLLFSQVSTELDEENSRLFDELSNIQKDIFLSIGLARFLATNFYLSEGPPAYRFIHFFPPHKPFILDSECKIVLSAEENEETWTNYKRQSMCVLRLFSDLLARLRELGVYDSAIIVLQSDTGHGMVKEESGEALSTMANYSLARLSAYAAPVFAIKPVGASAEMVVSEAPTHHWDTRSIIGDLAKGISMDDTIAAVLNSAGEPRRRRLFVVSNILRASTRRLQPYEIFALSGDGPLDQRWDRLGLFVTPTELVGELPDIENLELSIFSNNAITVGQMIELTLSYDGGVAADQIMFMGRRPNGELFAIQHFSRLDSAVWQVTDEFKDVCFVQIIGHVRSYGQNGGERNVNVEERFPLANPGCPPG